MEIRRTEWQLNEKNPELCEGKIQYFNGMSSFFFIFSAINSLNCCHDTELLYVLWKIFNSTLFVVSYLCNIYNYKEPYLFIDYLNIYSIALVFLSFSFYPKEWINPTIVPCLLLLSVCEYIKYNTIIITKNMSVVCSIIKLVLYLHVLQEHTNINYKILIVSTFFGKVSYFMRFKLLTNWKIDGRSKNLYIILLTIVFHICIANILCVSSATLSRIKHN